MTGRTRRVGVFPTLAAAVLVGALFSGCQLEQALEVDAGFQHTCALTEGGAVKCWGFNAWGQVGDGSHTSRDGPYEVFGLPPATQVTVAGEHSCALLTDGTVRCWGRNSGGQLGNGTTEHSSTPVEVTGISNALQISAGDEHNCALLADGTAKCWGRGGSGELGDGNATDSTTPVTVMDLTGVTAIEASWNYTCALIDDGTVECWGLTQHPQLPAVPFPFPVSEVTDATQISAGGRHTCALLDGGAAKCWGLNFFGELGDGTTRDSPLGPVDVAGLGGATEIKAGYDHTCALHPDGTVTCWGYNVNGQLGDGTTTTTGSGPAVVVSGLDDATALSGGYRYTCAERASTHVACWGQNDWGQSGGSTSPQLVPRDV